jgi:hypothetical protein
MYSVLPTLQRQNTYSFTLKKVTSSFAFTTSLVSPEPWFSSPSPPGSGCVCVRGATTDESRTTEWSAAPPRIHDRRPLSVDRAVGLGRPGPVHERGAARARPRTASGLMQGGTVGVGQAQPRGTDVLCLPTEAAGRVDACASRSFSCTADHVLFLNLLSLCVSLVYGDVVNLAVRAIIFYQRTILLLIFYSRHLV